MRSVALTITAMWATSFGVILGIIPFGVLYGARVGAAVLYATSVITALGAVFIIRFMVVDIPNRINKDRGMMPYLWCFSWGFLGATLARLLWFSSKNWF